MPGSSLNIIDFIKGYLTGDFKDQLSSVLGENRYKTQSGLSAAIPGILSGLDGAASTPDGTKRLASAVDDADSGILSNIGSMFGKGSLSGLGSSPLQSILGAGGLSELTGNIGRASGLPGKAVSTMLGFLAPVVFGGLKKLKQTEGLDATGLSSLLASQRSNIAAAMPESMRQAMPETYTAPMTEPHARMTETYATPDVPRHRSSLAWILPLAILGLGLLWWGSSHSRVSAGRDEHGLAERTAKERANVAHMASPEALMSKYQSVMDVAKAQGVQISKLMGQDGKLILQGTAPSLAAANKVWDEIKRVNPRMDDIVADIKVPSSQAQPFTSKGQSAAPQEQSAASEQHPYGELGTTEQSSEPRSTGEMPSRSAEAVNREKPSAPESSATTGSQTYVVKPGDTLSTISKHFYGNARDYKRILDANSKGVRNPNVIATGQKLEIPSK